MERRGRKGVKREESVVVDERKEDGRSGIRERKNRGGEGGSVKEAGEKSRERRRDNKGEGSAAVEKRTDEDRESGKTSVTARWEGGREEKGNVVERRGEGQMDKREGWMSAAKARGGGRRSGTETEKGKERERERPTPCTCVTVRPRTRRRVLISQRAPRRRASFCEPCFFRRSAAWRGATDEGARESRAVRRRRTGREVDG